MSIPRIPPLQPRQNQKVDTDRATPEMRKAAEGLEAIFTQEMMKAMRGTVEKSEFSLRNSASEIYQGMLDQEYAEIAARQNSLGLSEQIVDYWLRSQPNTQYNESTGRNPGSVSTGGTHEGQSSEQSGHSER
jgi:Rod binding domain-containing protein